MTSTIYCGDCRDILDLCIADDSIDSVVTDPPYDLTSARPGGRSEATRGAVMGGFMGMRWDATGVAFDPETWRRVFQVLKPGGHLLAFGGTRTYHRMVCAIEDAGFEIRDQIGWVYGSGFPKSLDVSKAIDKAAGAERVQVAPHSVISHQRNIGNRRPYMDDPNHTTDSDEPATDAARQWQGWGTALKPAWEPIVVARKPLIGTVAANVLTHGTGVVNVDGCRVPTDDNLNGGAYAEQGSRTESQSLHGGTGMNVAGKTVGKVFMQPIGRWPANLIHDGSDEVMAAFPQALGQLADASSSSESRKTQNVYGAMKRGSHEASANDDNEGPVGFKMKPGARRMDAGSAARFFYCAKASKSDRGEGNTHPTVKPTDLMRYLVRLVTPAGGTVLDPFLGSGSTGKAAALEGFRFIGIDLSAEYVEMARKRIAESLR